MGIGSGYEIGGQSYVAIFKESVYGTYPTPYATNAAIEPLSIGFTTEIVSQKLDTINRNRGFTKRVQLDKNVTGALEAYFHPQESVIPLAVAMGGGIASSTLTVGAYQHVLSAGNFDTSPASLSMLVRKGSTHHFQYTGGRVNVCTISGAIGEPIKISYDMIFKDSTQTGSDWSNTLSVSAITPFTYVHGTFWWADTEASLTSTAAEQITSFELTINNNLISDQNARALGSNVLQCLPPTRREIGLKITQRFDTTTAWSRFVNNSSGAVVLFMENPTLIGASNQKYTCKITLPKVYYNAADPTVGSPSEILMQDINVDCLVDTPQTSTGKDITVTFYNQVATYA